NVARVGCACWARRSCGWPAAAAHGEPAPGSAAASQQYPSAVAVQNYWQRRLPDPAPAAQPVVHRQRSAAAPAPNRGS
ncbi:MAG TPA: hypothetical protein VN759_08080, partial [Pseudolysinimonas sp.]|nr:hypothetical protein [Pseudolysinimonas sp.]